MNLGFKARIYLVVIVLMTLSLLTLGAIGTYSLQDKMTNALNDETVIKLDSIVSDTETWFKSKEDIIDGSSKYLANKDFNEDFLQTLNLIKSSGDFTSVILTRTSGEQFCVGNKSLCQHDSATNTSWYKDAINYESLIVSEILDDPKTGNKFVGISKSITQNGVKIGTISGVISINDVVNKINQMRFAGGAATLADKNAVFFASDDPTDIGRTPTEVNPGYGEMENVFRNSTGGKILFLYQGIQFEGFYKRINLTPDNHWTLMVFVDKETALAEVTDATWKFIWVGLVLLVVSCAGVVLTIKMAYKPLNNLKAAVMELAQGKGDLTVRLVTKGNDDLAQISNGFNQFIEQLQQMMMNVAQSTQTISTGILQLSESAKDNETKLVSHSQETNMVVTAITEMSESARSVAINVSDSNELTNAATQEANESMIIVDNAVKDVQSLVSQVEDMSHSINAMNADAGKITDVVSVIEGISEQINLLALNAAIEAARAGEAGRGFAVVADEVRALAVRTQSSTTEISSILQLLLDGTSSIAKSMADIQEQCQSSADSTAKVSSSLSNMRNSISEIDNVSTQIASATEEQNRVTDELSNNMLAIREIIESLVASGGQAVSATQILNETNNNLVELVGNFKIYDNKS